MAAPALAAATASTTSDLRSNGTADPQVSPCSPSARENYAIRAKRPPRTLPPWISSYEARFGEPSDDQTLVLNRAPARALPASSNNASSSEPAQRRSRDGFIDMDPENHEIGKVRISHQRRIIPLIKSKRLDAGRRWDHLRSAEPVIVPGPAAQKHNPSWTPFLGSSRYGRVSYGDGDGDGEITSIEALDHLRPRLSFPVELSKQAPYKRRRTYQPMSYKRFCDLVMRHGLVPLVFRVTVLLTSTIALALAIRVSQLERPGSAEKTQAMVGIIMDCVAVPYTCYMTWDEYMGRPLGLRSPNQKMTLILLDLFFIVFKSASTTLAFNTLVYHNATDQKVGEYSSALASFQLVGLCAWNLNLTVNVFRLVQRLGGAEARGGKGIWSG